MSFERATPVDDRAAFRHRVTAPVRFGDLDAMGHLNNLALLGLLETGRVEYVVDLGLGTHSDLTYVLASLRVDFRSQAFFRDELVCGSRATRCGRTSMVLAQHVWRPADDTVVAEAESVIVALGPDAATPIVLPDAWRRRIRAWEPEPVEEGTGGSR
ncbi:MAG: acyl-CoA thioesterase [Egibacteraceae bacterium]